MKRSLAKLLLALSLVVNPVTVLAGDFHDVEMQVNHVTKATQGHTLGQHEKNAEPTQPDSSICEMPCCEDSDCSDQGVCFVQYNSDLVVPKTLRFNLPTEIRGWSASITMVPDRELPPDNPPPIFL